MNKPMPKVGLPLRVIYNIIIAHLYNINIKLFNISGILRNFTWRDSIDNYPDTVL